MFWNYSIAFLAAFVAAWLIRASWRSPSRVGCVLIALGVSFGGGLLLVLLARETYAQVRAEFGVPIHVDLGRHFIQFFGASAIAVYLVLRARVGTLGRADQPAVHNDGDLASRGSGQQEGLAQSEHPRRASDGENISAPFILDAVRAFRTSKPSDDSNDEWAYRVVAEELDSGRQDTALWLKALVAADGDVGRQKALYIKSRVAILLAEERAKRVRSENAARVALEEWRGQFEEWFRKQTFSAPIASVEVESLVESAIASKVPLTICDLTGKTLLHLAAQCGAATAVDRLLKAGAEPNSPDGSGLGPLDYAEVSGEHATVAVLKRAGATRRPW